MTPEQIGLARHALGLPNEKNTTYRNRYFASKGSYADREWHLIVDTGMALRVPWAWSLGDLFFLTKAGAAHVLCPNEHLDPEDFVL